MKNAGQVPMAAPNVGGWPGGTAWLTSSTTLTRVDLAGRIASKAPPDNPARRAAASGDVAALADAVGRPDGFIPATTAALEAPPRRGRPRHRRPRRRALVARPGDRVMAVGSPC